MRINDMRRSLTDLKIHLDRVDDWVFQAKSMMYDIEDSLCDLEDNELCKKTIDEDSIDFLKDAALDMYQMIDNSPPRLSRRCSSKNYSVSESLYQSDFNLKKIV